MMHRDPRSVLNVRTHAITIPNDPTTRMHLTSRILRNVAIPVRVDCPLTCWPALGSATVTGAPRIKFGDTDTTLRRVCFALWRTDDGYLAKNWVVRTTCGTPRCVRPDHLELVRGAVSNGGGRRVTQEQAA
jgi:hypothetical protein